MAVKRHPDTRPKKPHGLPSDLIISLTSYRPRFATLGNTLKSLLDQTIRPDRIVLWVAENDRDLVPQSILSMSGVEVRFCRELRSYKKIIPTLEHWPDAFIVTADDDLYYEPEWLEKLVGGYEPGVIVCRRAHRPKRRNGKLLPYGEWEWCVKSEGGPEDLFPGSGAGALYPPGSLPAEVLNEQAFLELAPLADDVWLYFMARKGGNLFKQVGGAFFDVAWPKSQAVSLAALNVTRQGNDVAIENMVRRYGDPSRW